jgi:hypothetical protein
MCGTERCALLQQALNAAPRGAVKLIHVILQVKAYRPLDGRIFEEHASLDKTINKCDRGPRLTGTGFGLSS